MFFAVVPYNEVSENTIGAIVFLFFFFTTNCLPFQKIMVYFPITNITCSITLHRHPYLPTGTSTQLLHWVALG